MAKCDNFLTVENFNLELLESAMSTFCETYHLHNLVKSPVCFKNTENPPCLDLILTNCQRSDVLNKIGRYHDFSFTDFHSIFLAVLNNHARILKKDTLALREKSLNTEFFLVLIFLYSD